MDRNIVFESLPLDTFYKFRPIHATNYRTQMYDYKEKNRNILTVQRKEGNSRETTYSLCMWLTYYSIFVENIISLNRKKISETKTLPYFNLD